MRPASCFLMLVLAGSCGACAVVSVADAGVTVAANAVKVGANVVGGVSDVARAGVRVITSNVGQNR
jgi:hypothetical protein